MAATSMKIRVGFEMEYQCRGLTPMILALSIHYSRASDLVHPDYLVTSPAVPLPLTVISSATGAAASWRRQGGSY